MRPRSRGAGPADSSRALALLRLLQPGDPVTWSSRHGKARRHSAVGTAARLGEHCVAAAATGEEGAPWRVTGAGWQQATRSLPQIASLWMLAND